MARLKAPDGGARAAPDCSRRPEGQGRVQQTVATLQLHEICGYVNCSHLIGGLLEALQSRMRGQVESAWGNTKGIAAFVAVSTWSYQQALSTS